MSKKIIALLLCLLMFASVTLAGCSGCGEEVVAASSPIDTRTLSMCVITDETVFEANILDTVKNAHDNPGEVSEEDKQWADNWIKTWVPEGKSFEEFYSEQMARTKQYDAVEAEINLITKTQFSIQLNITYMSEDRYYEQLEGRFAYMDGATGSYTGMIKDSTAVENADGVPEYVYPEIPDAHVDIFFIGSEEHFNKFYEDGRLASLSAELSQTYKPLTTLIYPPYMQAVTKYNELTASSGVYAIPNNIPAGEYKYMLLNKEFVDKYKIDISDIKSWADCENYLKLVSEYEENCVPILLPEGMENPNLEDLISYYSLNTHYWSVGYEEIKTVVKDEEGNDKEVVTYKYNVNDNDFSLLGDVYSATSTQNGKETSLVTFGNTLQNATNQIQLASFINYNGKGYFASKKNDSDKVAIELYEGTLEGLKDYEDEYYKVLVDVPRIEGSDAYKGMFAVSAGSTNVSKSLQIISYLNTNPEFRNLLQYGIEGENYVLDENGYVTELEGNLYHMDVEKTGNIFNAYASDDTYTTYDEEGNILDVWGLAKQHASDVSVHPLFGFTINGAIEGAELLGTPMKVDNEAVDYIKDLSDDFMTRLLELDAARSISEIRGDINNLAKDQTLITDAIFVKMANNNYTATNYDDSVAKGTSVFEVYYSWLVRNGLANPAK